MNIVALSMHMCLTYLDINTNNMLFVKQLTRIQDKQIHLGIEFWNWHKFNEIYFFFLAFVQNPKYNDLRVLIIIIKKRNKKYSIIKINSVS